MSDLYYDVPMPQLGETVAEGTILKWRVNVGDWVVRDQPLFEVSSTKVDAEIPSPSTGRLVEIVYPEGATVEVGVIIAYIDPAR